MDLKILAAMIGSHANMVSRAGIHVLPRLLRKLAGLSLQNRDHIHGANVGVIFGQFGFAQVSFVGPGGQFVDPRLHCRICLKLGHFAGHLR